MWAVLPAVALWKPDKVFEHYLPAYNVRDTERGTEFLRDSAFPLLVLPSKI